MQVIFCVVFVVFGSVCSSSSSDDGCDKPFRRMHFLILMQFSSAAVAASSMQKHYVAVLIVNVRMYLPREAKEAGALYSFRSNLSVVHVEW